jgi:hypothetical protein
MKPTRRLSRRSFLSRVAGGAVLSGGALALTGCATVGHSDSDPSDPLGAGRVLGPRTPKKGCTDTDQGPNSDRAGVGRGSGFNDSDPGDPSGCGRGEERGQSASDSDSGPNADPARGSGGVTDSDSGPDADPAGRGRGTGSSPDDEEGVSDSDSGPDADPVGQSKWRRGATPI